MQQLTSLIESGDFDAANKLIKKQLNEQISQPKKNVFRVVQGDTFFQFMVEPNGGATVTISDNEEDIENEIELKKVEFKALLGFLKENDVAKSLNEAAKEYESSIDFTNDMNKSLFELKKMKMLLESPKWKAWMKATDSNFSARVNFVRESDKVLEKIKAAEKAFLDLEVEIGDVD